MPGLTPSHRPVLFIGDFTSPNGQKKKRHVTHVEAHTPAHVPHLHVHPTPP